MEIQSKPNLTFNLSTVELLFISLWVGLSFSLISIFLMLIFFIEPMQEKAVEKGYAEWVITNNKNGETKFVWK